MGRDALLGLLNAGRGDSGGTGKLVEWEVRGTPRGIIPEPGSTGLLVVGAFVLGWGWRRRGMPRG